MRFLSRLLGKKPQAQAGVVFDEQSITHTTASGNVETLYWHQLQQISIITNAPSMNLAANLWVLEGGSGMCAIEQDTNGMEALVQRLAQLPGLDHELVVKAMAADIDHTFVIWPRAQAPAQKPAQEAAQEAAQLPTKDDIAQNFLHTFAHDGEFPGGLAFAKALNQVKLDYSRESLARIDRLLEQIRTKLKPQPDTFIEKQENQNFLYLLCFYLGELVARERKSTLHWYAYDELLQLTKESADALPRGFVSSMGCIFENGGYFLPLSCLTEGLFFDPPDRSVVMALQKFISPATEMSLPFGRVTAGRAGELPLQAREAAQLCGLLAANGLALAGTGGQVMPTLATHSRSNQKTMTVLVDDNFRAAIASGQARLEQNPEAHTHMGLLYDGYITIDDFQTDALIVEARSYAPLPWHLKVALPYRNINHAQGFAVHRPRMIATSAEAVAYEAVFAAFFVGLDQHPDGARVWEQRRDESV